MKKKVLKEKLARSLIVLTFGWMLAARATSARADAPSEVRVSVPGVGVGNRPVTGGSAAATMHLRGMLEEEFKADGIKVTWMFLRGAGPAVNELFANDLADFTSLGDLPSIVGRASGLEYRVLAANSVRSNAYVAVPADSSITSIKDLRGKRIAVQKGTATHLTANKILESFGLGERDVRLMNMETNAAKAAIVTGDIDAAVGGVDYLSLRDQGAARILFSTRGGDTRLTSNSSFLGSKAFITKYPEHTRRVVKTLVLAAKWLAERETDPQTVLQLWTRSGSTFASYKEDWSGESLKYKLSPLLDAYVFARYNFQIGEAKRLGLTRRVFDFGEFVDARFLNAALEELGLQNYWLPRDAESGHPPTTVAAR
jgi:sulfonate transport system substrate-binding protein